MLCDWYVVKFQSHDRHGLMCLDEGDESTQWENEFLTDESVSPHL